MNRKKAKWLKDVCTINRYFAGIKYIFTYVILFSMGEVKKTAINKETLKQHRVLSLFSGCGGMDLGLEGGFTCLAEEINENLFPDWISSKKDDGSLSLKKTGFKTVFANDIRSDAKKAWVTYFSSRDKNAEEIYHLGSIVDLVKKAKSGDFEFPKDIDLVTGGFPCQDFSIAGKRLGFDSQKSHNGGLLENDEPSIESRGNLYIWMRDVISLTLPKMFIAENVKGLINLADVKSIIEKDFSNAGSGYVVVPARVLHAAEYGVPQNRERVIFFGFRRDALTKEALAELSSNNVSKEYDPYPPVTHNYKVNSLELKQFVSCKNAFSNLEEPEISDDPSQKKYSKAKYMGTHCQGQTEIKLDSIAPTIRSEHHGNIEYRRLSKEHGGSHINELTRGQEERRLSIRECARIQTFPDDYQFIIPAKRGEISVSSSDAYKIIGNAVPPILAYNIAMNISKKWDLYFGDSV